jgi:DNA polymerase III subunit epsilon
MSGRQIVLDTETTGLEPEQGHRVIEIGCVELVDRRYTHNNFHYYLNPDRQIDAGAIEVHGITNAFVQDKPRFTEIFEAFFEYIKGAELIIHNAAFDISFLDNEFKLLGRDDLKTRDHCAVVDSLQMARKLHPGQKNNLDALCKRYFIDNSQRTLHGALLDAEILADVYLGMTGGQTSLGLNFNHATSSRSSNRRNPDRDFVITPIHCNDEDRESHAKWIDMLGENAVWRSDPS